METEKIRSRWFHRNPGKAVSIFTFGLILVILLITEILLRLNDFQPGRMDYDPNFKFVGNLTELKGFVTDENGIQKIDPESAQFINEKVSANLDISSWEWLWMERSDLNPSIYALQKYYFQVNNNQIDN